MARFFLDDVFDFFASLLLSRVFACDDERSRPIG